MLKNIQELSHNSQDSIQKLNGSLRDLGKLLANLHIALTCFETPVPIDIPYCTAGWLVIQRRMDGSVDFYRGWSDYRQGFGDPSGEFWIGLETMHSLTQNRTYKLRIHLGDFEGNTRYAEYSTFAISDEAHNYTLSIGTYSGTAGDAQWPDTITIHFARRIIEVLRVLLIALWRTKVLGGMIIVLLQVLMASIFGLSTPRML